MAKSKDDIKYGAAQARLSEDEALRVGYVAGTPLEAGKIADSEPVDLFSSARNVSKANKKDTDSSAQSQQIRERNDGSRVDEAPDSGTNRGSPPSQQTREPSDGSGVDEAPESGTNRG